MSEKCANCKFDVDECKCGEIDRIFAKAKEKREECIIQPSQKDIDYVEPKKAKRFNTGKVEFHDIPLLGLVEVAKVAAYGKSKYDSQNWRNGASKSQYLNCAIRHIMKSMYGQENDGESKCMHLGHAAWNLLALIEKMLVNEEIDDCFSYKKTDLESVFELNDEQKEVIEKMMEKKNES